VDITAWLRRLGLGRYEQSFRDNEIDAEVLPDLTADDLNAMGIISVGHRRRILVAVAALSANQARAGTRLALNRLARSATRSIVEGITRGKRLPDELL
jgi:hypothetical protein